MIGTPTFPRDWKVGAPILVAETFSSRIWKVFRNDGSLAVVKDLKPFDDAEDELRGAHYLSWRDGIGAVRLLGFDGQRMLLEHAGERHLSEDLEAHGDRHASAIAAEVMAKLLSPSSRPAPADLQPLARRFEELFAKAQADRDAGAESLYVEAAKVADRLLSNQRDVRPLHGDLHHENIMFGPRGWLAIDPKGVLGDPAFDAANLFYNPLERTELCLDRERVAMMADIFATTLGIDEGHILDHAFAYGCLSAAWHAGDNNAADEGRELAIAAVVRDVRS